MNMIDRIFLILLIVCIHVQFLFLPRHGGGWLGFLLGTGDQLAVGGDQRLLGFYLWATMVAGWRGSYSLANCFQSVW